MTIAKLTRAGWKEPTGDSMTRRVLPSGFQEARFGVNFRVRTLSAIKGEIDVPNHTRLQTICRDEARWGATGEIAARQDHPLPSSRNEPGTRYIYQVIHDVYVDTPKPAVTGAWYYEEELELEVAGSPHVGLIVDLLKAYHPDKAKVLADVCAERGLTGAAFHLQGKPSGEMRFAIDTLAMAAGVRSYRFNFTVHQDWKRDWLKPEDDEERNVVRRNGVPVEEGLAMPSELRHALLPANPAQGETRLFRATGRFLRISGNGKEIGLPPNVVPNRNTEEELVVARGGLVSLMYDGVRWVLAGATGQRFPDNSMATPYFPDILRGPEQGVTVPRAGTLAAIYDPLMLGEDSLAVFVNEIHRPGWKGMHLGVGARMEVRYGSTQPVFNSSSAARSLIVITRD